MRTKLVSALTVTGLLLVACGDDDGDEGTEAGGTGEATTTEAPPDGGGDDAAASGAAVQTASSELGDILVDAEGMSLYAFLEDSGGEPTCYDACAEAWPPLTVEGTEVPEGLDPNVFSVVARDDGTTQLVAGDYPLYFYQGDQAPGDVTGQEIPNWSVVDPSGNPVEDGGASGDGGGESGDDEDGSDY